MEWEGKGPGGKGFQGLAVFCTPFLSGEGSRWWERRFQGVVGFSEKWYLELGSIEKIFSGWAKLRVLLWTCFFKECR